MPEPVSSATRLRYAGPADLGRIQELIRHAGLPDRYVEEWLAGFLVAESPDGLIAGCGGLEVYDDTALLRSVVVDAPRQGTGLGRRLAEALETKAWDASVRDLYLFTIDSWSFWHHLGFADLALAAWREPVRASWQYRYVSRNLERFQAMGIHSMRKSFKPSGSGHADALA